MRYLIWMDYDGAEFCGWQIQPSAPSVQGALEQALSVLLREKISVTGAGRTDTGVNAVGYPAHFDCEAEPDCAELRRKLNAILPKSIAVRKVERAKEDFHARFDARERTYRYFLHREKDPFLERYSYLCAYPNLDFGKMNEAAALLVGRKDFSCFEKTGADNKTSVCTVFSAKWVETAPGRWYFEISADRFLRNMVRAIVGTLIDAGRGKRSVESISELLRSGSRSDSGESVPGHALFLVGVKY